MRERMKLFQSKDTNSPARPTSAPKKQISRPGTWSASKFKRMGFGASPDASPALPNEEKCSGCGKTVYITERIATDNQVWHKACLKCDHCHCVLKLGSYASLNGKFYCKPHFKQLFKTKGNYNEGFGEEKLTAKWSNNQPIFLP